MQCPGRVNCFSSTEACGYTQGIGAEGSPASEEGEAHEIQLRGPDVPGRPHDLPE